MDSPDTRGSAREPKPRSNPRKCVRSRDSRAIFLVRYATLIFLSTNDSVTAWRAEVQKLTQEELRSFLRMSKSDDADLEQYATAIDSIIQEKVKKSKSLKVAKWLEPLFECVNMYAPIITTLSEIGPSPSSLIFGGITCVLSVSTRYVEYQREVGGHAIVNII